MKIINHCSGTKPKIILSYCNYLLNIYAIFFVEKFSTFCQSRIYRVIAKSSMYVTIKRVPFCCWCCCCSRASHNLRPLNKIHISSSMTLCMGIRWSHVQKAWVVCSQCQSFKTTKYYDFMLNKCLNVLPIKQVYRAPYLLNANITDNHNHMKPLCVWLWIRSFI